MPMIYIAQTVAECCEFRFCIENKLTAAANAADSSR
jgi:hypothetical protein